MDKLPAQNISDRASAKIAVAGDFLDIANEALLAATVLQYRLMIADNARDLALASMNVRCWGRSGDVLENAATSAFDPGCVKTHSLDPQQKFT